MAKEILIADSDKMIQKEFEKIFEATDYQIVFSKNDEEALLRGRLFKPALIIGGRDLCSSVRTDVELKDLPFILILNRSEDLSENEQKLLRVDGMISKPFNEDKILNKVNRLMISGQDEEVGISEDDLDWKSFSDIGNKVPGKKEELSLDEMGESEEEEIIELVDVVEEPESRMSIDDFAIQQKEESTGEIPSIESWGKQGETEEPLEEELLTPPGGKEEEIEEVTLPSEEKADRKEVSPEKEFFEKIELNEVLLKMGSLQPSIEKEWPAQKEEKIVEESRPASRRAEERYQDLKEFEAALKGKVEVGPVGEELQPFFIQEPKQEARAEVVNETPPVEPAKEMELQELSEEEFPESFLEELEQELGEVEEEDLTSVETEQEIKEEEIGEDEISKFFEEEVKVTERVLEQPFEEPEVVEELREAEVESLETEKATEIRPEQFPSPPIRLERNIEEVISKAVQEMMQDFITKIIPGMTQNVIVLTLDRIEKMVKEIVPDLAEKVIQEEIKRLQRGEKD